MFNPTFGLQPNPWNFWSVGLFYSAVSCAGIDRSTHEKIAIYDNLLWWSYVFGLMFQQHLILLLKI